MKDRLSRFALGLCFAFAANFPAFSAPPAAKVKYGIDQPIEQIEFRDIAVGDALRILSEQSALNIIASKQAADIHVTMFLRKVTPKQVIEALAKTYNLWYQQDWDSNIVRIYTVEEYRLEQVEYKKEATEIFTLKNAKNALDLAETIQNLFSERVLLSYGRNQNELMNDLQQRFQRFDMVDGRTTLSGGSGGGNSQGGGFGSQGGYGGQGAFGQAGSSGINQGRGGQYGQNRSQEDYIERLESATQVLKKLSDDKNGLKLDLLSGDQARSHAAVSSVIQHQAPIYVGVIKHQNRVLVRTRDADAMNEIRQLYKRLDMQSSMLLMEVKILSVDLSDGFNSLFDFKVKNDGTGASLSTMGALTQALNTASAAFDPSFLATFVSDNFEARLQLLENEGRVTELATPMLLTTNQEVSRVFVGDQQPIVTGYSASQVNTSGVVTTTAVQPIIVPDTELRDVGTTLLLTPNINADRTVSIQLLVEQSTIGDQQATIPVQVGNELVDADIDVVQERTFSGTVVATDGTAVAVGGLIEEGAGNKEKKVPVLGDIPLLGFFFREDAQSRSRKELVVIIKPHIIGTPNEAQDISRTLLQQNSTHPNAENAGNLNVYGNPDRVHKGYRLEQPFKEYNNQDSLDRYQWDYPNPRR